MAKISRLGEEYNTNGDLPAVGSAAPDFKLTTGELNDVTLADYKGKKKLLSIVPSLDTPTCAISTIKFNQAAKGRDDVVILIVSADLPFAQGRFCTGEKLDNVIPLSIMRSKNFSKDYGVLIQDGPRAGITARAVVVLDENDKVIYTQLVHEMTDEPDYDSALAVL
jgi:thiol peroxidase